MQACLELRAGIGIQLASERKGARPELRSALIDQTEQLTTAGADRYPGRDRGAQHPQIMVLAQGVGEPVRQVGSLSNRRTERLEGLQLVPEVLGLLAPLVQAVGGRVEPGQGECAATLTVDARQPGTQDGPTLAADAPTPGATVRFVEGPEWPHKRATPPQPLRPDRGSLLAQHMLKLADARGTVVAARAARKLFQGLQEHPGVTHLAERAGNVPKGGILAAIGGATDRGPQQP